MLCPIQRIPRYKLLLEGVTECKYVILVLSASYSLSMDIILRFCSDYRRHLPKDHPDVINAEGKAYCVTVALFIAALDRCTVL
jgi:hypothetical protein